ncbi:uncharacterized protein LOC131336503 [Rhododendron vialii]|uniref:uncharacterized protein LOC131336503 n=1 Tax=Rhododendron vialii TaxID=182163 RepID=UPI00265EF6A3|nr:uncharacterized protein LOC131336503 [Rhododendron vialii]
MEEEEQQQEEEQQESEAKRFWDPIHSPRHLPSSLQTHHRSLSDSHTQFKSCSISPTKHTHFTSDVVFPPINHEGLHLSSPHKPSPSLPNHPDNNTNQQVHNSPCSSGEENGFLWVSQRAAGTGSGGGGEVARWVSVGFELLRSRVTCIASSLCNFAGFGGVNWSVGCAARMVAAVLVWWLFAVVRRRRRDSRVRRESRDQMIRVIKEKDEKISQLLHQIAQMNQLLLALHGGPMPGTGGVTK